MPGYMMKPKKNKKLDKEDFKILAKIRKRNKNGVNKKTKIS